MVIAIIRDSFFGWCCRLVTGGRVFKYPEEVQENIRQHYLADDDPYLSTIGVAITSPIVPSLPLKNPRRNSPPRGDTNLPIGSFLTEDYLHPRRPPNLPLPPDPVEDAFARRPRRPSEESVRRSEWLRSKPSAATLVQEGSYTSNITDPARWEGFGGQSAHRLHDTLRTVPKAARLNNNRSADTLVPPARDRDSAYPPISPRRSSKKAASTETDNKILQDAPSPKTKNSAVSMVLYYVGRIG
jgi:hypothetical protein